MGKNGSQRKTMPGPATMPVIGRYAVVSGISTIIDIFAFAVLCHIVPIVLGNVISYSCGVVSAFALHQRWTFKSPGYFIRFSAINLGSIVLSTSLVWALSQIVSPVSAKLLSL